jgi:steroid delta-isomerase-like uncharacterized protein
MSEENKALLRRFFEDYTRGDPSLVDELLAEDFVDHDPPGPNVPPGRKGVKQVMADRKSAFPDMKVTVDDQVAEDDKVVNRMTITGTHQGVFMGIPATGKSFSMQAVAIFRVRDGKITDRWGQADVMGMMQQLGAAPPPPGASRD